MILKKKKVATGKKPIVKEKVVFQRFQPLPISQGPSSLSGFLGPSGASRHGRGRCLAFVRRNGGGFQPRAVKNVGLFKDLHVP